MKNDWWHIHSYLFTSFLWLCNCRRITYLRIYICLKLNKILYKLLYLLFILFLSLVILLGSKLKTNLTKVLFLNNCFFFNNYGMKFLTVLLAVWRNPKWKNLLNRPVQFHYTEPTSFHQHAHEPICTSKV